MRDNVAAIQLLDALYMMLAESIPDEICESCPVVRTVRDMRDAVKDASYDQTITELGISFPNVKCPCDKADKRR